MESFDRRVGGSQTVKDASPEELLFYAWFPNKLRHQPRTRGQQLDEVSEINMPLNLCLHASAHLWPLDDPTLTGTAAASMRGW